MEKILLKSKKSKQNINGNSYMNVSFHGNKRLFPSTSIDGIVNQYEQYIKERENCTTIRLVCAINPICSNVLFNNKSEFVFREGSDDPFPYNHFDGFGINDEYLAQYELGATHYSSDRVYQKDDLINDTQLSRYSRLTYHCGLDIFDNHILRSTTFKSIMIPTTEPTNDGWNDTNFNTIEDYLRNYHGSPTEGFSDILDTSNDYQQTLTPDIQLHLYTKDDLYSFKEAVSEHLTEENGWLGFVNAPKVAPFDISGNTVNINKPINNRNACEFVDMYPERELFSFTPIYNEYRHRIENNWNYCLTYPSSSTTDVPFIDKYSMGIKIGVYDDTVNNSNGVGSILIYSTCKHGLSKNDNINLYETSGDTCEMVIKGATVNEIVDEYTFYITRGNNFLSEDWVDFDMMSDDAYKDVYSQVDKYVFRDKDENFYPNINGKVNLNKNNQNFSFKKTIKDYECEYYVRIFSRLPNWKFADVKPSEYELYKNGSNLINQYQQLEYDFESHNGRIAFAKNIYNDDVDEIVFTDDINIGYLRDNLGRPLTSIYLTILKNNRGYKDWYNAEPLSGKHASLELSADTNTLENWDILKNNDTLEYSHCFGKLNSGFKLSWRSLINKDLNNVLRFNRKDNESCSSGLSCANINKNDFARSEDDEIIYRYFDTKGKSNNLSGDTNFYGDIVCFSPIEYNEQSLQMVDFRFNTAQRDGYAKYISDEITYIDIEEDDYDHHSNVNEKFVIDKNVYKDTIERKEGYYYCPHYEIPIRTLSTELNMQSPKFYTTKSIIPYNNEYIIKTTELTYIEKYDNIVLYDKTSDAEKENGKYHYLTVTKVSSRRILYASGDTLDTTHKYRILKPDETIPSYAVLLKDQSFQYVWRDILQNGDDDESDVETYPFTNGALYVNKFFNFYLKRQDPNNYVKDYAWDGESMHSSTYPKDSDANIVSDEDKNNYYEADDIVC